MTKRASTEARGARRRMHGLLLAAGSLAGCGSSSHTTDTAPTTKVTEFSQAECKIKGGETVTFRRALPGSCASAPARPAGTPRDDAVAYCGTTQFTDKSQPTILSCPRTAPYACKIAAPNTVSSALGGKGECAKQPSDLVGCEFLGGCVLCGASDKPADLSIPYESCTATMRITGDRADLLVYARYKGNSRTFERGVTGVPITSTSYGDYQFTIGSAGFTLDASSAQVASFAGWEVNDQLTLSVTAGDPSSSAGSSGSSGDPCGQSVQPRDGWSSSGWSGGGGSSSSSSSSSGSSPCP